MTTPDTTTEQSVARLRVAVSRLARLIRQQDQSGYGPTFVATLNTIAAHGPLTLGELAAREQVAPPTITKVVDKMVANGLVERRTDSADRRVTRVAVTGKGNAELEGFRRRRNEWLATRLDLLEPDDRARLLDVIDLIERLTVAPEDRA